MVEPGGRKAPAGHGLIVAIDGPSGAGKSTLAKLLAAALGYINIDTGAMYRAVALAAHQRGVDLNDAAALGRLARQVELRFERSSEGERLFLDGTDVSSAIRSPENSLRTARVAALPEVRAAMVALQRRMGENGGVVLEGRDIGSVVFPSAEIKFFLLASAEERGRRRCEELRAKGLEVDLAQTIREVVERDAADSSREHAPLVQPQDAVVIDTTGIDIPQVLQQMLEVVSRVRQVSEKEP